MACGIVEPRDGADSFAEIDRAASELGLVALSFHTRFQGVSMDSRWLLRYLERMGERGMLPIVHAMDDTPEEALWKLASIARALPDLTILALDAFGGFEATRQCFFVGEVAPNIVFDTSLSYNFDFIEDFVGQFGADRVVFGTDLYSYPVGRRISHLLPQIEASSLSDDEKAAVLGGTARHAAARDRRRGLGVQSSGIASHHWHHHSAPTRMRSLGCQQYEIVAVFSR